MRVQVKFAHEFPEVQLDLKFLDFAHSDLLSGSDLRLELFKNTVDHLVLVNLVDPLSHDTSDLLSYFNLFNMVKAFLLYDTPFHKREDFQSTILLVYLLFAQTGCLDLLPEFLMDH